MKEIQEMQNEIKDIQRREREKMARERIRRKKRLVRIIALLLIVTAAAFCFSIGINDDRKQDDSSSVSEQAKSNSASAEDWNLLLVNKWNPLPKDYEVKLKKLPGGEKVDERIYKPLMEMLKAAEEKNLGKTPIVVAGYRTYSDQQKLYDKEVKKYTSEGMSEQEAKKQAGQKVALPGTSEHELGLAVDLNGTTYDLFPWLQENCHKYGFIHRYPAGKTEITGTMEEIWHYRYVGKEAAAKIHEQGVCLEEYLNKKQ